MFSVEKCYAGPSFLGKGHCPADRFLREWRTISWHKNILKHVEPYCSLEEKFTIRNIGNLLIESDTEKATIGPMAV